MKKLICFFTIFVFWGITDSMAQGLQFWGKSRCAWQQSKY